MNISLMEDLASAPVPTCTLFRAQGQGPCEHQDRRAAGLVMSGSVLTMQPVVSEPPLSDVRNWPCLVNFQDCWR